MLALWPLGHYRVTAILTTLPYNSFKSYCANTNIYINLIYRHAVCLKITYSNAANSWYALKRPKPIILQLYTLLTFKYITIYGCAITRQWADTIYLRWSFTQYDFLKHHYISHKIMHVSSLWVGRYHAITVFNTLP